MRMRDEGAATGIAPERDYEQSRAAEIEQDELDGHVQKQEAQNRSERAGHHSKERRRVLSN